MRKSPKKLPFSLAQGLKVLECLIEDAKKSKVLKRLGPKGDSDWIIDLKFSSSAEMKKNNQKYLGKKGVTDVISFPSPEPFRSDGHLGTLLICSDVAKKQALDHSHSLSMEVKVLLVHGFLHLLGFDHEVSKKEEKKMMLWEKKLLSSLTSKKSAIRGLTSRVLLR